MLLIFFPFYLSKQIQSNKQVYTELITKINLFYAFVFKIHEYLNLIKLCKHYLIKIRDLLTVSMLLVKINKREKMH